jgi:CHAT domain-containing protein
VKDADSRYWQEALRLSQLLVGPVANRIGKKRLVVVSEGALQYVPFAALPSPKKKSDALVPLVVEHEIVNLPSASTLAVLREETSGREYSQQRSVAIFADPVFEKDDPRLVDSGEAPRLLYDEGDAAQSVSEATDRNLNTALRDVGLVRDGGLGIPRLPFTRREAEAIADIASPQGNLKAIDFDASRTTAMSPETGQYRIVHFATHGLLNGEHPELSGIVLSLFDEQGKPQDGFLGLHDIYNLDLPVDLVVLSACSSGLGKQVRGEGLVGIVRGFMYAGAARVVASLWKVEDEATRELMETFYRQMLIEKRSPASALRHAQVAMWRKGRWRSPFFWGAFTLQGDWK